MNAEVGQREPGSSNDNQSGVRSKDAAGRYRFAERTFQFGDDGRLAGVIAEPLEEARRPDAPVVLMWNVGLNHHVGPYRIYVDLARQAAIAGFASLRFDLSGLGDSEQARDFEGADAERAVVDLRTAMDAIEKELGARRFVLVGFCSSVDSAHAASLADERVVGLANLEGYSFPTPGHKLRKPLRYFDRNRWERWFFHRRQKAATLDEESPEAAVFQRDYPTPERLAREYRSLVDRGMRFLFIYVRGDSVYEYKDQLFEFLGDRSLASNMEVEFYANADHIFSRVLDREMAVGRVVRFLRDRFGG